MVDLLPWADVRSKGPWPTLLLGNGSSMAVWSRFGYGKLLDVAAALSAPTGLSSDELRLFRRLRTQNFEEVLATLLLSARVGRAMRFSRADRRSARASYVRIRASLAAAVRSVHVPWSLAKGPTLMVLPASMRTPGLLPKGSVVFPQIRRALKEHERVFTTNYDLIAYWSLLEGGGTPSDFFDLFTTRDPTRRTSDLVFDPMNTDVWGGKTSIFYLHGALHLYRAPDGRCLKRVAAGDSILDGFDRPAVRGAVPLVVSEGTEREKRRAIARADYLSHCLTALARPTPGVVVFGHGLGPMDGHIVQGLAAAAGRGATRVAVSCRPPMDAVDLAARQSGIASALRLRSVDDVLLFDSTTHPLGDPMLSLG